jgi:uncharacterized protein with HEPN domain
VKDDRLYLVHILECIARIETYVKGKDEAGFLKDSMLQDAVIRNLQVLSESSRRLSERLKSKYNGLDWSRLAGFRNIVVHDYLGVELDRVWQILEKDLPELKATVIRMQDEVGE